MCNNCIHKLVCSIYRATGGMKTCGHHNEERHGQWIMRGGRLYCSRCGVKAAVARDSEDFWYTKGTDYCPSCGANMRGAKND